MDLQGSGEDTIRYFSLTIYLHMYSLIIRRFRVSIRTRSYTSSVTFPNSEPGITTRLFNCRGNCRAAMTTPPRSILVIVPIGSGTETKEKTPPRGSSRAKRRKFGLRTETRWKSLLFTFRIVYFIDFMLSITRRYLKSFIQSILHQFFKKNLFRLQIICVEDKF